MESAGEIRLSVNTLLEPFTLEKYNTGLYDVIQCIVTGKENKIKVVSIGDNSITQNPVINGYYQDLGGTVYGVQLFARADQMCNKAFLRRKVINTYPARLLEFKYMLFETPYNGPTNRLNVLLSNTKETQGGYNFCLEIK